MCETGASSDGDPSRCVNVTWIPGTATPVVRSVTRPPITAEGGCASRAVALRGDCVSCSSGSAARTTNARAASIALPQIELPSRVQAVVIEDRVQHQPVAALGLAAPDRVVREEDHVAFLDRDIHDHRTLRDLGTGIEETGDQQVARVAVAED